MKNNRPFLIACGVGWIALLLAASSLVNAQSEPTAVPVVMPTRAGQATSSAEVSPSPTRAVPQLGATSTGAGVVVEVRDKVVPGNVRQAPSTDAEIIGKIKPGNFYPVLSKSGKWLQILFGTPTPETTGWVFDEIVSVTGDLKSIKENGSAPTANVPTVEAQKTETAAAQSVEGTPGGFASATSARASATGLFIRTQTGAVNEPTLGGPRPTFTMPPPFAEATLSPRSSVAAAGGLPPIVPILGLAVVGLLGLMISSLRRL